MMLKEPVKRRRSLSGGDQAAAAKRRRCFSPPQENAGPMVIQVNLIPCSLLLEPQQFTCFCRVNLGEQ